LTDIFISYAHIDNQPMTEGEKGWITHLVNNLGNRLAQKLGRKEYYDLWMDYRLKGSDGITPEIMARLAEVEILVVLLSPGWVKSKWCQLELTTFCQRFPSPAGRVFVVELDSLTKEEKPPILHDVLPYQFWYQNDQKRVRQLGHPVPQPKHEAYFDRVRDLSDDLAEVLKKKVVPTGDALPPVIEAPKATVYVPPVSRALLTQRTNLVNELRLWGIAVLPTHNKTDDEMETHLAQCSHFVQLLDDDDAMGIPCAQHAIALKNLKIQKHILQWRDSELKFDHADPEQHALLTGKTVIAATLTDFMRMVREAVLPKPPDVRPTPTGENADTMVFVHACPDDMEQARGVVKALQQDGYDACARSKDAPPDVISKQIARYYQGCDVLLVLHHQARAYIVDDCLWEARSFIKQREKKPKVMICQGSEAEELSVNLADALLLPCRDEFQTRCLTQFLQEVGA
jgi:hypothetical protein